MAVEDFTDDSCLSELLDKVIEATREAEKDNRENAGRLIKSGIESIDKCIGGFLPGELAVIGGPDADVLRDLAMNISLNVASDGGENVLYVSCRAEPFNLAQRFAGISTATELTSIKYGRWQGSDSKRAFDDGIEKIKELPIRIKKVRKERVLDDLEANLIDQDCKLVVLDHLVSRVTVTRSGEKRLYNGSAIREEKNALASLAELAEHTGTAIVVLLKSDDCRVAHGICGTCITETSLMLDEAKPYPVEIECPPRVHFSALNRFSQERSSLFFYDEPTGRCISDFVFHAPVK